ncbi:fungal-specific transcription factor domain-containing protein [Pseudoneurospora amorphoporcata]|uniref:Fungal-specific transcription factor domain-containing protein n=1 Tax=Pseudoneurospora amorphoporcata TaxID=241081 RepID=A0AAN6NS65_9PEZI|nr:fungal-specific transcription factor domain-containing protein [Pseudoneurospora amorphoporcata]
MVTAITTLALQKGHAKKTPPKKARQQKASKTKACYNCHRKRLRCDKSLPSCLKCSINGEECLGYGIVLRWAACNSPTSTTTTRTTNKAYFNTTSRTVKSSTPIRASTPSNPRGIIPDITSNYTPHNAISNTTSTTASTTGISSPTLDEPETIDSFTVETPIGNHVDLSPQTPDDTQESNSQIIKRPVNFIKIPLTDPLLNGLSSKEKWYMHHFATIVCRDLVSIDQKERNPFRAIIPLVRKFDYLQSVVLATAAMHLSTLHKYQGQSLPSETALVDALMLKSRALHLLRAAISDDTLTDQAMILSAIVFLVNLDLIDSGRGGWKAHVEAARRLISSLYLTRAHLDGAIAPLVNAIAADCLTYRIYGATISGNTSSSDNTLDDGVVLPYILQNAEAYSYHCAPPAILQMILSASQLCSGSSTTLETDGGVERIATAAALLHKARNFDVQAWVYNINGLPLDDDLEARVSVASAHRAAACLFVLLSVPEAGLLELPLLEPKDLVQEILGHLSCIPEDHVHLKGTVWPTFIVGAETDDLNERAWCLERLVAVWTKNPWTCPWGYVHTATEMLQDIWRSKDLAAQQGDDGINWLQRLKATGNSCLIV